MISEEVRTTFLALCILMLRCSHHGQRDNIQNLRQSVLKNGSGTAQLPQLWILEVYR